jgi:hypothetical protein
MGARELVHKPMLSGGTLDEVRLDLEIRMAAPPQERDTRFQDEP